MKILTRFFRIQTRTILVKSLINLKIMLWLNAQIECPGNECFWNVTGNKCLDEGWIFIEAYKNEFIELFEHRVISCVISRRNRMQSPHSKGWVHRLNSILVLRGLAENFLVKFREKCTVLILTKDGMLLRIWSSRV